MTVPPHPDTPAGSPVPAEPVGAVSASASGDKPQRGPMGMFAPGNTLGRFRRFGPAWTVQLRQAATPDAIKAIIDRALDTAQNHADWRAAADARDWIFKYLTPVIEREAAESEATLDARPMEQRVLGLLDSVLASAEATGTPEAAAAALRGVESAANVLRAARTAQLGQAAVELDPAQLDDAELEQLQQLLARARRKP